MRRNCGFFLCGGHADRAARPEIDEDQGFRVRGEPKRGLRARKLDDEGSAIDRGDTSDPQFRVETVREIGPRGPRRSKALDTLILEDHSDFPHNIRAPHPSNRLGEQRAAEQRMPPDRDQQISRVVEREESRLRRFIRRRVPDPRDVEDILQEVFSELVEANRRLMPIDHVAGWLVRVAQNRIIDLFRKKQPERFSDAAIVTDDGETLSMEDLLPAAEAGPEALYTRGLLFAEFERALAELPDDQREVFVAHEFEGRSFKQIADDTGVNVNTLLSRKRYAVLFLREKLQRAFDATRTRGR